MICIILTRVYYCWGLPSSFEGYFVLPAAISLMPGVHAHLSVTHSIGWFAGAQHTREHHLNFQLSSSYSPASPQEEPECRWQEAQDGHFTLGVSYFAGDQKQDMLGGKSGFLFSWVFGFCFLVLFWFFGFFFLACLHCLKADPPQRQIVLLLTLSFNIKRKKSCQGAKGLCQKEKHTGKLLFFKSSVENSRFYTKLENCDKMAVLKGVTSSSFFHHRGYSSLACATLDSFYCLFLLS